MFENVDTHRKTTAQLVYFGSGELQSINSTVTVLAICMLPNAD